MYSAEYFCLNLIYFLNKEIAFHRSSKLPCYLSVFEIWNFIKCLCAQIPVNGLDTNVYNSK